MTLLDEQEIVKNIGYGADVFMREGFLGVGGFYFLNLFRCLNFTILFLIFINKWTPAQAV